ncbi:MAG: DUF190 domain-containing protein [Nocardioides sp.]|uniref:DUF190 domain-containing protein n=1 Tax=Nocardioides sp. TaxID=35761 RepID=UPI0039E34119
MTIAAGPAQLTVYARANDRVNHRPLTVELLRRAHQAGLAGATVLDGTAGFGLSQRIHTERILSLSDDLPSLVILVDTPARLREFAADVAELVEGRLMTLTGVEVIDTGRPPRADS